MKIEYTGNGGYYFETNETVSIVEFCPTTSTHTLHVNTTAGFIVRAFKTHEGVKRYIGELIVDELLTA